MRGQQDGITSSMSYSAVLATPERRYTNFTIAFLSGSDPYDLTALQCQCITLVQGAHYASNFLDGNFSQKKWVKD